MRRLMVLTCLMAWTFPACADITVGAVLSLTGPAASLGIPERNTIELLPRTMAGQPVRWVVLDDASDTTAAVRAVSKLVDEEQVDVILGPSNTPNSLAVLDAAAGTPMVSLAGSASVIEPPEGARRWAFKLTPTERIATGQVAEHMKAAGIRTFASIGFANSFGDGYIGAMEAEAAARGIQPLLQVRYNLTDTSLTPQALRLIQARPDAIFVAGSGTPGVAPMIELRARGYTGPIYTNQGIANPDALRVGGRALDGTRFSAVPVLVAEQLPDSAPVKASALAYVRAYEAKYGPGSRSLFGAILWDAFFLADAGAEVAIKQARPGTPEFRLALRNAMENVRGLAGAQAVFNLTPTDHSGAEASTQVMVEVRDGGYRMLP